LSSYVETILKYIGMRSAAETWARERALTIIASSRRHSNVVISTTVMTSSPQNANSFARIGAIDPLAAENSSHSLDTNFSQTYPTPGNATPFRASAL
jgi:hypothetical protein